MQANVEHVQRGTDIARQAVYDSPNKEHHRPEELGPHSPSSLTSSLQQDEVVGKQPQADHRDVECEREHHESQPRAIRIALLRLTEGGRSLPRRLRTLASNTATKMNERRLDMVAPDVAQSEVVSGHETQ